MQGETGRNEAGFYGAMMTELPRGIQRLELVEDDLERVRVARVAQSDDAGHLYGLRAR